ncbi:tRNA preQ1(34) S-adenosylmethionine ribosyltransferase-isomerase QueA [Calditerrivibrio nitroreducens]|uniref:S-adenosylmethionine:tRNA ribosyltransferase-isomerase n=1 Tax=Calditerrivibrio nitroreducens (strain DSM 19672 / NBRC 101217 / Yu37-1) TaxID=768670 RepID=E4TJ15_CALNY|nr:tRNA preQ1(34) S-adenosylmethionine ribosyltransferase-isomerase QueA [Calditerrivibrio nitroreducens]ADR19147.1 S-adenosylmethionine--tRNA ribosyltransferase-isomerase [Calditerrivibrio nitroreducens DSM 19672]
MSHLLKDYDFELPEELIAQYPAEKREESNLMVVDRSKNDFFITKFKNIVDYLPEKSFLVVNNTKVLKSRIYAQKISGGRVEVFFIEKIDDHIFKAMTRGRLKDGDILKINDSITLKILGSCEDNLRIVELSGIDIYNLLDKFGHIPLPPYIKREDDSHDETRYQTVYAQKPGSVAAPTAGLHFTEELIERIRQKHEILEITLNVGIGTFRPVKTENIQEHQMHSEKFFIPEESFKRINLLKSNGHKLISVGTTTTRCLEAVAKDGLLQSYGESETDIFIKSGYKFQIIDHLVTNFHLPKSTLFILVSTFAGLDLMKKAYAYAIEKRMRFFSYGDAMLII